MYHRVESKTLHDFNKTQYMKEVLESQVGILHDTFRHSFWKSVRSLALELFSNFQATVYHLRPHLHFLFKNHRLPLLLTILFL